MSGKFVLMHTPVNYVKNDIVIDIRGLPNRYKTALAHLIGNQVAELTHANVTLHDEYTISHYPLDEKEMEHIQKFFSSKTAPNVRIVTTNTPSFAKTLLEEKIVELRKLAAEMNQPISIRYRTPQDEPFDFDEVQITEPYIGSSTVKPPPVSTLNQPHRNFNGGVKNG